MAAALMWVSAGASAATPGPATSAFFGASNPAETITVEGQATQELNAYVAAGDTYQVTVGGSTGAGISGFEANGTPLTCAASGGGGCTVGPITATAASAGVWQITLPALTTWSVAVTPAGQTQPERGRVWTSAYNISQNGSANNDASDISFGLYDVDQLGNLYDSSYNGYNGIESTIAAEGVGPVPTTSATGNAPCSEASDGSKENAGYNQDCPPQYNEFEADPRGIGLPASAPEWNPTTRAQQSVFVLPSPTPPAVSGIALNRNGSNLYSGTIAADVTNYNGQADITITDSAGHVLRSFSSNVTTGANAIQFDGLDNSGAPISATPITIKVALVHEGEIHFLLADVERFTGGLEVDALTGPNAGTANADILYWNDSAITGLGTPTTAGCQPTPIDATAGVHSTGGVHTWSADPACASAKGVSWGDAATIDNYTFANPGVAAQATVYAPADVQITKSASPANIVSGTNETYTLTVKNNGPGAALNAVASDPLPAGLAFVSASGGCAFASGTVTCQAGTLASGATASFTVVASVPSSQTAQVTNTATVSSQSPDPNPNNNTSTITTPTSPEADLAISKSASPATATPGGNETYTLKISNNGPSSATDAIASDPLPKGLTFVSASNGCAFANNTVTCQAGTLAPGATATFSVVAKVPSSQTARITNAATVSSQTPDPNPNNNTSTITTPVGPKADLAITKTASTGSVAAGGQVSYTLVVNDNGPSDATGVTVSDALPAGLSLVSAKPSQGTCSGSTCRLGTIADGGSAQIVVTANVAAGAAGSIANTATVTGDNPDPKTTNNTGTSTITIVSSPPQPASDLQIVKTVNHQVAYPGQTLTYTLRVTNHGPSATKAANITDTSSMGLKVLKAKPSQGKCTIGRPLKCALGAMKNKATASIIVTAQVLKAGSEGNTASGTTPNRDPQPHNNISTAHTTLRPMLELRKTASAGTVAPGQTISYHLTVTNPTSVAVKTANVGDVMRTGLTFLSATPKAKQSGAKECWTIKTLAAHRSETFVVRARAGTTVGAKTNTATVTAKGVRGATARRAVAIKTPVKPVLRLVKTASAPTVHAGGAITYRITVSAAKATTHAVRVCDALPLGLSFTGATPAARAENGRECWTISTLAAGQSRILTVHARALKGTSGTKTNHATATADGAKGVTAAAPVRVIPAPRPPATPVTG